jgi:hypothetical protein
MSRHSSNTRDVQSNKSSQDSHDQSLNDIGSQEDVDQNNSKADEASTDDRTIKNQLDMLNGISQRLIS